MLNKKVIFGLLIFVSLLYIRASTYLSLALFSNDEDLKLNSYLKKAFYQWLLFLQREKIGKFSLVEKKNKGNVTYYSVVGSKEYVFLPVKYIGFQSEGYCIVLTNPYGKIISLFPVYTAETPCFGGDILLLGKNHIPNAWRRGIDCISYATVSFNAIKKAVKTALNEIFDVKKEEKLKEEREIKDLVNCTPKINCGACGYKTCYDFVKAVVTGKADPFGCKVNPNCGFCILEKLGLDEENIEKYSVKARERKGDELISYGFSCEGDREWQLIKTHKSAEILTQALLDLYNDICSKLDIPTFYFVGSIELPKLVYPYNKYFKFDNIGHDYPVKILKVMEYGTYYSNYEDLMVKGLDLFEIRSYIRVKLNYKGRVIVADGEYKAYFWYSNRNEMVMFLRYGEEFKHTGIFSWDFMSQRLGVQDIFTFYLQGVKDNGLWD